MRFVILLLCPVLIKASLHCFNVIPSHAISNTDPIAELFHVTAGECLNYCISESAVKGDGCVSVVFHKKFETCQLYGHDGSFGGAEVVYLEDHEFYIRSSWEGQCQDKTVPQRGYKAKPETTSLTQPTFQPISNLPQFSNSQFPQEPLQIAGADVRKAPTTFENELFAEIDKQQIEDTDFRNDYQTTTPEPRREKSGNVTIFKNPTRNYKCSKAETLSYFLVHGSRLSTKQMPQRLNGVDQSSCLMYCSQNINAIGQNIPCFSLNYEPTNEICEMYGEQKREQSTWASLAADEEFVFADKFCIKSKKTCPSETIYTIHMHKQMTKNVIAHLPGLNSKVACLAECIDHKDCKAVTYTDGMCIFHSSSDASLLVDGSEKTMVIENGCHVANSAVGSDNDKTDVHEQLASSWQEWSLCQYGSKGRKMRVRMRDCDDCDEDLQMDEC